MQLKTVTTVCVLIIGSVIASQYGPAPGGIKKLREEIPQEHPSGPQGPIASQGGWRPFGLLSKLKGMFSKSQPSSAQEPIASQEGEPASGIIVTKPKSRASKEQPNSAQGVQEQASSPQESIASQEDEQASGVIVPKSRLPKQEQPGSALKKPGGNVLLRNVDGIASLQERVKEIGENEGLLKAIQAAKKKLRKNVFNKDIGTDKNIFEAVMAAKGKSLSFLFEVASPKVLEALVKQSKRLKVKEWAEGAMKVYEKLKQIVSVDGIPVNDNGYNGIIELIGGLTTFGTSFIRNKFLTDGVYTAILGGGMLRAVCFQLLLDSATPTTIRLALNSEWLTYRFDSQDDDHTKRAKARHSALEEAYKKYVEPNIARQLGIALGKDGRHLIRGVSEHIASFLRHQLTVNDSITEPSGRIDPSILEPFKVHLKDGIPEEIIGLAVGKEQVEGSKLNDEQVKQVRPYNLALVTYIFEHELDIEQFIDRTGLYVDYETFVAYMDVYGPDVSAWNIDRRVFHKFQAALDGKCMLSALFSVRNFYATVFLYDMIPWEKPFTEYRLRFLAKVTQFPLDAFPKVMPLGAAGDLFRMRSLAILARRTKNIREAAEKNDLDYLRKHLLDGNITEHGLQSILEHGSKVPTEAFKLILSVISYPPDNFAQMTLEQRTLAEGHKEFHEQLHKACDYDDLESIRTLITNPNCTPGLRIGMFLRYPNHGVLVKELIPDNCELILAKWMNRKAPQSAELVAVINRCLQYYTAKHE